MTISAEQALRRRTKMANIGESPAVGIEYFGIEHKGVVAGNPKLKDGEPIYVYWIPTVPEVLKEYALRPHDNETLIPVGVIAGNEDITYNHK